MFRVVRKSFLQRHLCAIFPKQNFLTNEYKCNDAWNSQTSSSILQNLNLHEFYKILEQNYTSKGIISAIDVDMFTNAVKDPSYIDEMKDLLHKLRLSAETGNTLESTHHAAVRNYIEYGNIEDLIYILKNPLTFGVFLDSYTANILLDKLITAHKYKLASDVASVVMLQEDFSNEITCTLCQYATYKFLTRDNIEVEPEPPVENKKVEEIKIRIKFLRNDYYDDHFDITDIGLLSGKTLVSISKATNNNVNNNLQIIGWLFYKKYEKVSALCETLSQTKSFKVYNEVIDIIKKESGNLDNDNKAVVDRCIGILNGCSLAEVPLEESIKISIENAINKIQNKDIATQKELFNSWVTSRTDKLEEQSKRLDRAKRIKVVEDSQNELKEKEQKLWFFENEEKLDLEIEKKEKLEDASVKNEQKKVDEAYVPPEIIPKRR